MKFSVIKGQFCSYVHRYSIISSTSNKYWKRRESLVKESNYFLIYFSTNRAKIEQANKIGKIPYNYVSATAFHSSGWIITMRIVAIRFTLFLLCLCSINARKTWKQVGTYVALNTIMHRDIIYVQIITTRSLIAVLQHFLTCAQIVHLRKRLWI